MSLLTTIDGVPLYDTMREALLWGKQYDITGYHIHYYNRIRGYMSGKTHEEIKQKVSAGITNPLTFKELKSGDFEITDAERKLYNSLRPKTARTRRVAAASRPSRAARVRQAPQQTQQQPQQQPAPSYTPPSAGGGSSSGGGY
tara:strand:- start:144 stop:572 length:429 start_codon:yes stop_codon:yes gene_type:complete